MATYKILSSTNEDYDPSLINRLKLLYKGGYDVQANADIFLRRLACETAASFEDRKAAVAYLPYMSDIIDYYASMLFSGELAVSSAADSSDKMSLGSEWDDSNIYKLFLACADLKGNSLEESMRKVMTSALIHKRAFIGIDFPKTEEPPITLLEEEVTQSARPYLYDVDPLCIIDWAHDENGKFLWIKLASDTVIKLNPLDTPKHQIEFKIWTMKNGNAHWETYKTNLLEIGKMPSDTDEIPLTEEGTTTIREIPILEMNLPSGIALGNKIGPICENIYQRESILVNGENKSVNAMRIVFLGDESSAPGKAQTSAVQENPFRAMSVHTDWESKGFGVLGANDKMEIVEAEGHAFQIFAEQNDKQIEKLKEVVHQMGNSASAQSTKSGRSAASQQEGRHSTEMLLTAYGTIVRDFIKQIMNAIASARNEAIVFTVAGLDNFSVEDREQLIEEAKQFPTITQSSISPTFTKLYTEKLYLALINGSSHEESLQIREEIISAIDSNPDVFKENIVQKKDTQFEESNNNA